MKAFASMWSDPGCGQRIADRTASHHLARTRQLAGTALAVLLVLAAAGCGAKAPPAPVVRWMESHKAPQALGGHSAAVLGSDIVVAGGSNWPTGTKVWRDEVWAFDGSKWRAAGKLPVGLTLSAPFEHGGNLYLVGGWKEGATTGEAFVYSDGSAEPMKELDLPEPRAQAGSAVVEGSFYVVGGMTDAADFKTAVASMLRMDPFAERATWRQMPPLPRPLALSSTIGLGGKVYVFGGMGPAGATVADSAQAMRYDPERNVWEWLTDLPSPRRGAAAVAIDGRYILIVGGCRNVNNSPVMLDEVLAYDTHENRYLQCPPLPLAALCEQAVLFKGKVYVIGGEDQPRHRTDRVIAGGVRSTEK